jgi:hypothetical protein
MKSPDQKFIASYIQTNNDSLEERVPYFFFHIPKSAGMSLFGGLSSTYQIYNKSLSYKSLAVRADDKVQHKNIIDELKKFFNNKKKGELGGIIASHIPNYILQKINHPFKFITVLRDPVDRVISAFTYDCMRNSTEPSKSRLIEFINDESNRNISVKTLLGIDELSGGEGKVAAGLIKESFYAYCFVQDIDELTSAILSKEGLPNLVMGKENQTLNQYKYYANDDDRKLITSLNTEDCLLVSTLKMNSKQIPEIEKTSKLSSITIRVKGAQTSNKYEGEAMSVSTESLLQTDKV